MKTREIPLYEIEGLQLDTFVKFQDQRGETVVHRPSTKFTFGTHLLSNNRLSGTIRGLHYQLPVAGEEKYVWCEKGRFLDVLVDLRVGSRTYGCWTKVTMDESDFKAILIPVGIAHGYQTLVDDTSVGYMISGNFSQELSRTINPLCEILKIEWPLFATQMSERDSGGISLNSALEELESSNL